MCITSSPVELWAETYNCILYYYATPMALCPFWILLWYFLLPLNYCKQRDSMLTSKTILTWDQLPRTLGEMTNGFLLLGKMFVMHHTNIFTDEIVSSLVPYLFFFIKFSQVRRVQDWLWNTSLSVTDQIWWRTLKLYHQLCQHIKPLFHIPRKISLRLLQTAVTEDPLYFRQFI